MVATALAPIGRDLAVGPAATAWLVSVMYLASAIGQPVAGRLADQFGPRRIFLGGALLVVVGGLAGVSGLGFGWLVASRAVIGLGTGAVYPAALTMIREQADAAGLPPPTRALALLTATSLVTLTVGPPVGGLLVDGLGWWAVFGINLPLGLLVTVLGLRYLPRSRPRVRSGAAWRLLDLPGIALFGTSVTLFLLLLTGLPRLSPWLLGALVISLALLTWTELRVRAPFLDLRMLLRNTGLLRTYVRVALTFFVVYGVLFGLTPWLQEVRGLSATGAGLVVLAMSGVGTLSSFLGARAGRPRWPLLVSALGLTAGSLALLDVGAQSSIVLLAGVTALFGLPNGLGLVANQVMVYRTAPADGVGAATGLSRTAQYTGAMVATSVVGLAYTGGVTTGGLHTQGWVFGCVGAVLIAVTVADRSLRPRT
jgi:predicted MFS family arabinose efflux permease